MRRKLISALICGILTFSLVSCANNTEKINEIAPKAIVDERVFEGSWARDYTKDEITSFHEEIITKVEDLTKIYELDYEKDEKFADENGERVSTNEIYVDNLNPEPNRLESMYYGFKIYGEDLSQGQLILKIGFNLDKEIIKEEGEFNFEVTSIASYSEAFTGVDDRDYTELNNSIYSIITGESSEKNIENNLDGIIETVTIKDNYLLYKLETKKYNFKK